MRTQERSLRMQKGSLHGESEAVSYYLSNRLIVLWKIKCQVWQCKEKKRG